MSGSLRNQLRVLYETSPAQYGMLQSYSDELEALLTGCSHNYPTVKQLLESSNTLAIPPQVVGNLLTLCDQFGILVTHSERNTSNRYDLTQFNQDRMQELVHLLNQEPLD
jgi:hypothetical protein